MTIAPAPPASSSSAQPHHRELGRAAGVLRRPGAPHGLGQFAHRYGPPAPQHQRGEQDAMLRGADRHDPVRHPHLERTEQPERQRHG
ncbi:hypothetical protein [Phytohabitans kaempferiae]|uniref:Uncharacterized protein n=1 Tax=Phytohabitans kaempferiae TaxID=1620943 RepID=A0ABV6MG18_9ACTN